MVGLSSFLALVMGATLWLFMRDDPYVAPPPGPGAAAARPAEAAAALQELLRAMEANDPDAARTLAAADDSSTAQLLSALVENVHAIPLDDVDLRYIDELDGPDTSGRWSATVATTWRVADADDETLSADVRVDFASDGERVVIAGVGGAHGTTPVWMSGPLDVRRDGAVVVMAAAGVDRYATLARRAVVVVRRVLPGWDGSLVVEVPRRASGVDDALAVERGTFRNVAGVTAAADGSDGGGDAPVHVLLNPQQMRRLRAVGAQVVVSHEAVHVATNAPAKELPTWLSEGFADYVALRDVDLPVATTASQVIAQVRREGLPRELPGDQDFNEQSDSFGAAYEAAWLACRLLALRSGEKTLLQLYRRADGARDFGAVFQLVTGQRVVAFTREWGRFLADSAD
ncbi:hypothetical protein GCM10009623_03770 [Nocardioides aestuarii]|uniref:DUF1570 domain-containing protein n=1 Tax=Nocardioides aestuarii TaxID=252231 RepID=A0ABW4TGA5_9ACTN